MEIQRIAKGWILPGALFGLGALLLSMLYAKIIGPLTLKLATPAVTIDVRQKILDGASTTPGEKLWAFFSGVLPLEGNVWMFAIVTGIVLAIVGRIIYGFKALPKGRTPHHKLTLVFFYSSVVFALIYGNLVAELNIGFVSSLVTILIYWGILAFLMMWVFKMFKIQVPV